MREGIFNVQLGNLCPGSLQPLMSGGSVTDCDGVQMWDLYLYNGDSSFQFAAAQPSPGQAVMADTSLGGGRSAA